MNKYKLLNNKEPKIILMIDDEASELNHLFENYDGSINDCYNIMVKYQSNITKEDIENVIKEFTKNS
jgi:hypothetical protein